MIKKFMIHHTGKLSAGEFSTGLDVGNLIKIVRNNLLCGMQAQKSMRTLQSECIWSLSFSSPILVTDVASAEKSFFKAHIDTPRSKRMFGSLIVFFPTTYEGGSLINGLSMPQTCSLKPKTFKWPMLLFTVTLNMRFPLSHLDTGFLSHIDDDSPVPTSLSPSATSFKSELETLLLDPTFLPDGGVLGFDLEHCYPVQNSSSSYVDLKHVGECLKGTDGEVMEIAKELSLHVSVWGLIHPDREGVLLTMQGSIPGFNEHQGYYDDFDDFYETLTSRGA